MDIVFMVGCIISFVVIVVVFFLCAFLRCKVEDNMGEYEESIKINEEINKVNQQIKEAKKRAEKLKNGDVYIEISDSHIDIYTDAEYREFLTVREEKEKARKEAEMKYAEEVEQSKIRANNARAAASNAKAYAITHPAEEKKVRVFIPGATYGSFQEFYVPESQATFYRMHAYEKHEQQRLDYDREKRGR